MGAGSRWAGRLTALSCVALLTTHFAFTLLYLSGPNLAKAEFGSIARAYIRPFFGQNWHLFSPNPGISSRKLAVRCQGEQGEWSEFFDPLEPMFTDFFENRIGGLGKLIFVYRGIADNLLEQAAEAGKACKAALDKAKAAEVEKRSSTDPTRPDPTLESADEPSPMEPASIPDAVPECSHDALAGAVVDTPAFEIASRYARQVCDAWLEPTDAPLARFQFKLLEFFPVKYSERRAGTDKRWSRVVELPFPVVEGVE